MKTIVLKNYTDKNTGISYNAGMKVEYADDRANELAEKGFVKLTEKAVAVATVEKKVAKTKSTTKKTTAKKK